MYVYYILVLLRLMGNKYDKEDAYRTLELINSWINNVDTKASFALAFQTFLIGSCINNGLPAGIKTFIDVTPKQRTCVIWINVIAVSIFLIACTSASTYLLLTLVAKTRNKARKKSVMFFGTIAAYSLNDFKAKTMNMSESELIKDLLEQVHTNSEICMTKFQRYNMGIKIMIFEFIYGTIIWLCGLI